MPIENPFAHTSWLGQLQPEHEGLVVSPSALTRCGVTADANVEDVQAALLALLAKPIDPDEPKQVRDLRRALERGQLEPHLLRIESLAALTISVLDWREADLVADDGRFVAYLPQYDDSIRPTHYVPRADDPGKALLLVRVERLGLDLDALPTNARETGWRASPELRFERLLRETGVCIGLLFNGERLRLVYAPRDQTAGHLSVPVAWMCEVAGRPILAGLRCLLRQDSLFIDEPLLAKVLVESRKAQNEVSTELGEQVLDALYLLVGGFRAANESDARGRGELLRESLHEPQHVYGGMLTVLLRLVFILYAEDRGLLSDVPLFGENYSLGALFEQLDHDDGLHHDHMHKRFGAWARLLTVFRMLHDGASAFGIPPREGRLFDPDAYPFLEGRPYATRREHKDVRITPPAISDGVIHQVLHKLRYLKSERLSYRTLDVEQIGSIYEGMMGFTLGEAEGVSIGVGKHEVVVDLDKLLARKPDERAQTLAGAGCKLSPAALRTFKAAKTRNALIEALGRQASKRGTLPQGALFLQPTEERRRTGSHYTPRALTQPIVQKTLRPQLDRLVKDAPGGKIATPTQVLSLKVCDPAMGSGAFLVESCRFLSDALVQAWDAHGGCPEIPLDETEQLHARRIVAQRCLYGVDKNPFAVDLAKLSLWLFTLAKDHPFTFLDHALRYGDSLVGLGREQIASFDWGRSTQLGTIRHVVLSAVSEVEAKRAAIHSLGDSAHIREKAALLRDADDALANVRAIGDLCILAFFSESSDRARQTRRQVFARRVEDAIAGRIDWHELREEARALGDLSPPAVTFHWEIEFPEVFSRERPGFDAMVGNPPFLGGKRISTVSGEGLRDWLAAAHVDSNSNADLVAHFFRRAFSLIREHGASGLIATNTIAQGDTRLTGLRWIVLHGGDIYAARRRVRWPGLAAVVVSVIHLVRGAFVGPRSLDERDVPQITSFLFPAGGNDSPITLFANAGKSHIGTYVLGMGFTFDDKKAEATPIAEMHRLIANDSRNAERILPYIGGGDVNASSTHSPVRFVIDFGDMSEEAARRDWPDLMEIVERKVRPARARLKREAYRRQWWQHGEKQLGMRAAVRPLPRVLVNSLVTTHLAFAFVPSRFVFSHKLAVFVLPSYQAFAVLQSHIHEEFARRFSSTLGDALNYSPTDCFETYPFPANWQTDPALQTVGQIYYEYRAGLMLRNDEGLTKTYNRFHDPNERSTDIIKLRELHSAMDRAVLDTYGWTDIPTACEFILDYAVEEPEPGRRARKKPWRYRWPDEVRDKVLARLLELNGARAEEERAQGLVVAKRDDEELGDDDGAEDDGESEDD